MEKGKKIVIYQKNVSRPVIMHDSSDKEREVLKQELTECLRSNVVKTFSTNTDDLIIRPSEISSILISTSDKLDNVYSKELGDDTPKGNKGKKHV